MQRRSKKTASTKRRSRAAVARKPKAKRPVLVSAREKRIALDEAVKKRLEFLEESVKNLWLMREQMDALSKQVGNNAQEIARLSVQHSVNSQEATENYRAIEALKENHAQFVVSFASESEKWREAIGSLAANVHDKLEAMRRGE